MEHRPIDRPGVGAPGTALAPSSRAPRGLLRWRGGGPVWSSVLILRADAPSAGAALAHRRRGAIHVRPIALDKPAEVLLAKARRAVVVALLPKSRYLAKRLEVPQASPQDMPKMVELEVEALLPPEFERPQISYRLLPARREGYAHVEAYAVRSGQLFPAQWDPKLGIHVT